MALGLAVPQDFLKVFLEGEFGVESDSQKFHLRTDSLSPFSSGMGSEFLATEDLENMMTSVFQD